MPAIHAIAIPAPALPADIAVVGTGPDPIAAVRDARANGWDGALRIETADGMPIMTAAAGWDGSPIWS